MKKIKILVNRFIVGKNSVCTYGLPDGTEFEVVALMEPKVIRPKGAEWGCDMRITGDADKHFLMVPGVGIAATVTHVDGFWKWSIQRYNWIAAAGYSKAHEAAEQALAEIKRAGFSLEETTDE